MSETLVDSMNLSLCLNDDSNVSLRKVMFRDGLSLHEALNQCVLIGSDFLLSSAFGEYLAEYCKETSFFNWDGFLAWLPVRLGL